MTHNTPSFRELYDLILNYSGLALYEDVLLSWLPKAQEAITELSHFRTRNTPDNAYSVSVEDLWEWYAINRVNDYLLLRFQMPDEYFASQEWLEFQYHTRHLKSHWKHQLYPSAVLTREEYRTFFEAMGFEIVPRPNFHPFHHEIVTVTEEPQLDHGAVLVEEVCWDNLMFGEMLFSRSGVRIGSYPDTFYKKIAETSPLYFTYYRRNRETHDLSQGWGHNSQWRTEFRRDYEEKNQYGFNTDGKSLLGAGYLESLSDTERDDLDDLTIQERIELLTYRSFVTCTKDAADRFPYDDSYFMPKNV